MKISQLNPDDAIVFHQIFISNSPPVIVDLPVPMFIMTRAHEMTLVASPDVTQDAGRIKTTRNSGRSVGRAVGENESIFYLCK